MKKYIVIGLCSFLSGAGFMFALSQQMKALPEQAKKKTPQIITNLNHICIL